MLWLYVQAPFATFRTFTAGSLRPTAPTMTPSAAYGLLLNLAGIEMRHDDGKSAMTLIGKGLPDAELAIGSLAEAEQHNIFQQLHNYPVGNTGAEHRPACKGSKYNITPVRRAFLSNLRVCLGLRSDAELENQVRKGLAGEHPARYGLPFVGDNNFLPDRIDLLAGPREARWLMPMTERDDGWAHVEPMRLSITIDRSDMSRTATSLFHLSSQTSAEVPEEAWVHVRYS